MSADIAIVHERFTELGGSELVVSELHSMFPGAPIFTAFVDHEKLPVELADATIVPSALQRVYRGGRGAHLMPAIPGAFRRFDLGGFDAVITSHHTFANRVRPAPGARFVSYTYTPARWMWEPDSRDELGAGARFALRAFAAGQRPADRAAASRPDELVAISNHVAERIRRWWGRRARVVPPPTDTDWFTPDDTVSREDFFLIAGRLVEPKRPEVAIRAAAAAGVRLVVAGEGRLRPALESMAGPSVEWLGRVDRESLRDLFRRCGALLFPAEEDFGLVPVEAQACGAPVIGPAIGGLTETVIDGSTGLLYPNEADREVGAMADAIKAFDPVVMDDEKARANATRFSRARFRSGVRGVLGDAYAGT